MGTIIPIRKYMDRNDFPLKSKRDIPYAVMEDRKSPPIKLLPVMRILFLKYNKK